MSSCLSHPKAPKSAEVSATSKLSRMMIPADLNLLDRAICSKVAQHSLKFQLSAPWVPMAV